MVDLARMRSEYEQRGLDVADVAPDPIDQFLAWLDDAVAAELTEPNAMVVATVDPDNRPRSRVLHPIWEWDGEELVGWVATAPTPLKVALKSSPLIALPLLI